MISDGAGGSLHDLRRGNAARVLDLLASEGPMHRAELARRARVSRTTITTITRDLVAAGVLAEVDLPSAEYEVDGRAHDLLGFHPEAGWTAGVCQTLDQVSVHVSDLFGREVASRTAPVDPADDWRRRAESVERALDETLAAAGGTRDWLLGAGIGLAGQINRDDGIVHGALADQPWHDVDARAVLTSRLGVPVLIENYVRLETLAESKWGAGRGRADVLYLSLANGIAVGMLLGSELYRGALGGSGELGHVSVDLNGPACRCGNRGCLVLYAGAPAILAKLRPSLGRSIAMTDVLRASGAGDRSVQAVLRDAAAVTGRLLASVCNLINPELIIVGGQTSLAGPVVVDAIRTAITDFALAPSARVEVVPSELGGGPQAGAAGGAAMISGVMAHRPEMLARLLDRGRRRQPTTT